MINPANCQAVQDFSISGEDVVVKYITMEYKVIGISGGLPTAYLWIITGGTIVTGQNTNTVTVFFNNHYTASISCTLTSCNLSLQRKVKIGVSLSPCLQH